MPSKIFYLKLDSYYCHERISMRDRKGEEDISVDYLDECNMFYEKWLNEINVPYKVYEIKPRENGVASVGTDLEQIQASFLEFLVT